LISEFENGNALAWGTAKGKGVFHTQLLGRVRKGRNIVGHRRSAVKMKDFAVMGHAVES